MNILYRGKYTPKSKELFDYISENYPKFISEENPDLILVAGGDGTMLSSIQRFKDLNVPFFGIGLGTLNFLMNDIENIKSFLKNLEKFHFDVVEARTMKVDVVRNNESVFSSFATNEIMLGNGIMDYHHFVVNSTDHTFNNTIVNGQSIIVSTSIGSTAISYNNDMQVIPSLNLDLLAFSTVLANKSEEIKKFIRASQDIEIKINTEREECLLFIDGKANIFQLERNDRVILSKGEHIQFAFINYDEFELKRLSF